MNAYRITYKKSSTAKKQYFWIRFAETQAIATTAAAKAVSEETFGLGHVISVEPTNDPREC